ncbi:AI-2E family transporter [Candidatus Micrarchaeota archaeon]|nr:AI-2E family transporter [Candidatus Micrarchaeota archaeon]
MAVQDNDRRLRMIFAALLVVLLFALIAFSLWPFVNAFFIAVFSYIVLRPVYSFLRKKGLGKTTSALTAMLFGLIVIGIPSMLLFGLILDEAAGMISAQSVSQGLGAISTGFGTFEGFLKNAGLDSSLNDMVNQAVSATVDYFKSVIVGSIQSAGYIALALLVIIFSVYYMLVSESKLESVGHAVMPFNRKNTDTLIKEFKNVVYSVLACSGLIGLIQVIPLTLIFIYLGVPGAIFWGFIALVMSFVPFVGVPVVWIPIAAAEFVNDDPTAGTIILIMGIFVAVLENFRPILQNKVGKIHPMISLLGVIVGVQFFGILGIVIGPIILSHALLTLGMFREEYL